MYLRPTLVIFLGAMATLFAQTNPDRPRQEPAKTNPTAGISQPERRFVEDTLKSGHEEVELSRMATQKASDRAVKDFAQRLVDDHSKANQELENIAKSKSISMPAMRHSTPANISNATGADFDRAYINQMIANHQKGVANFERMSTQAQDAQLRDFVTRTLPTLREHLSQAQSLKK